VNLQFDLHPLCTLFPRMGGAEFAALCDDIKANGLRAPIVLHEGMILDGGNRYRACLETGARMEFVEFGGGSAVSFVLSANLHRRHMTAGQQAAIVASAQDWATTQPAGQGGDRRSSATLHLITAADRAAESGASLRTQKMADKVAKADPDLAKKVAHGEVSLPKAVASVEAKAGKPKQEPVRASAEAPESTLDDGPSAADLLDGMERELRQAQAQVAEWEKAMLADGAKAELAKALRRAEHAERRQHELMEDAAAQKKRADFYERQLARCGKAIGQRDLDKVAAAVESFVRAQKVAA
jgi:hypothetical protein